MTHEDLLDGGRAQPRALDMLNERRQLFVAVAAWVVEKEPNAGGPWIERHGIRVEECASLVVDDQAPVLLACGGGFGEV